MSNSASYQQRRHEESSSRYFRRWTCSSCHAIKKTVNHNDYIATHLIIMGSSYVALIQAYCKRSTTSGSDDFSKRYMFLLYSDKGPTSETSVSTTRFFHYTVFNLPLSIIIYVLYTDAAILVYSIILFSMSYVTYNCHEEKTRISSQGRSVHYANTHVRT
jgi:hypothetical protein